MTIKELHAFLVDCCRRGVSADAEVLVDASVDEVGLVRCHVEACQIQLSHDEDETPYVVLEATDDAPPRTVRYVDAVLNQRYTIGTQSVHWRKLSHEKH